MKVYAVSLILVTYIALTLCLPDTLNDDIQQRLSVRSPKYDFGLGKRRYMISGGKHGTKRLPQYNFGLGKRSQSYQDEDDSYMMPEQNSNLAELNLDKPTLVNLDNWENEIDSKDEVDMELLNELRNALQHKRARPYSFGLGKRRQYDFGLGKRFGNDELDKRLPNRYNFGLGKR